jgi:hypothetical protein
MLIALKLLKYSLIPIHRLAISARHLNALPMRLEEQKFRVNLRIVRCQLHKLPHHKLSKSPQFIVASIARRIKHLLKHPKELRLHQHHWHVQIYSDSMEKRDCTLDFAVVQLLPRLQAPRACTNDFGIQQTVGRGQTWKEKQEK